MNNILRQSTSVVISFGPFVSNTDAVTLKTGLVSALDHASTGIMLSKNGGTLAVRHASVTASTYDAHGCYKVTLDTTDIGTLGDLRVIYTDATTCLPVWRDFKIVPATVYDAIVTNATNTSGGLLAASGATTINANIGTTAASTAQTGDAYARVGAAGAGLTALGDTRIANLDATISSRTKPADTQARVTLVDTVTTLTGHTPQTVDGASASTRLLLALPAVAPNAWGGLSTNKQGACTWYVAASGGDDSRSGLDKDLPMATIPQAITNAQSGDTIQLEDGTYTVSIVDVSKSLKIRGEGPATIVTSSDGATFNITSHDVVFEALEVINTNASGTGIVGHTRRYGCRIVNCSVTSNGRAVSFEDTTGLSIEGCQLSGGSDIVHLDDCQGEMWNSFVFTQSTSLSDDIIAINASIQTAAFDVRNCLINLDRDADSGVMTGKTIGIKAGNSSQLTVSGTQILANVNNGDSGSTGIVRAIQEVGSSIVHASGCQILGTGPVSSLAKAIECSSSGKVLVEGCVADPTKFTGTINNIIVDGRPAIRRLIPQAGSSNTVTLDSAASGTTDAYKGRIFSIPFGTGAGQTRQCTAYNGTTKVATVDENWVTNPTTNSYVEIIPTVPTILGTPAGASVSADIGAAAASAASAAGSGATLTGRLTSPRAANLDNLDAPVSEAGGGDSTWTETEKQQALASLSIGADIGLPRPLTWVIARIDGDVKARVPIVKGLTEDDPDGLEVGADFRQLLGDDDAVASITGIELIDDGYNVTITAAAFDDLSEAELFMNAIVKFRIKGGVVGQIDRVRISVLTVGSQPYSAPCSVKVVGD